MERLMHVGKYTTAGPPSVSVGRGSGEAPFGMAGFQSGMRFRLTVLSAREAPNMNRVPVALWMPWTTLSMSRSSAVVVPMFLAMSVASLSDPGLIRRKRISLISFPVSIDTGQLVAQSPSVAQVWFPW
jgi:hypothetical protein